MPVRCYTIDVDTKQVHVYNTATDAGTALRLNTRTKPVAKLSDKYPIAKGRYVVTSNLLVVADVKSRTRAEISRPRGYRKSARNVDRTPYWVIDLRDRSFLHLIGCGQLQDTLTGLGLHLSTAFWTAMDRSLIREVGLTFSTLRGRFMIFSDQDLATKTNQYMHHHGFDYYKLTELLRSKGKLLEEENRGHYTLG